MEVNHKMTFVGVYRNEMIVHAPGPIDLPKLCIVITAQTPASEPFKALSFDLLRDEEVIQHVSVNQSELGDFPDLSEPGHETKFFSIGGVVILQPFRVEKSCTLRVVAHADGATLSAAGLRVTLSQS